MDLKVKDSKDLTAREILHITVEFFRGTYPERDIRMEGPWVYIDGECKFNTEDHNLLYNLNRLTDELKEELL